MNTKRGKTQLKCRPNCLMLKFYQVHLITKMIDHNIRVLKENNIILVLYIEQEFSIHSFFLIFTSL